MTRWAFEGRCWLFGDDVPNDDGLMDRAFFRARVADPDKLAPHLLELIRPDFAKEAKPGDIILAGRRFALGNPHPQGAIALKARRIGVLAEGLSTNIYRLFVSFGVSFVQPSEALRELAKDGENVAVDFSTGSFRNLSTGAHTALTPLPGFLLETIAAGGTQGHLRERLAATASPANGRANS